MIALDGKTRLLVTTAVVFVLACGATYYAYKTYYIPWREQSPMTAFSAGRNQIENSFFSGDYTSSITQTMTLIKTAPNKTEEGYLKIFLASAYIHRLTEADDKAQGVKIYKEIIGDSEMPPRVRARALTDVAALTLSNGLSFYQLYFTEPPFNAFVPATGTEYEKTRTVYLRMLELSDQTYPTSQAEYAIAGNYYAPMVANGYIIGAAIPDAAKQMRRYVTEGDSRADANTYSPRMLAVNLLYRALALGYSANLLNDKEGLPYVEKAYQAALDVGNIPGAESDPAVQKQLFTIRFFYANSLLTNSGNARGGDIRTILKPFGEASERLLPDTAYNQKQFSRLAALSPEFKQYLVSAGYVLAQ